MSLLGCSYQEAVSALRNTSESFTLVVCDGFDPEKLSIASSSGSYSHVSIETVLLESRNEIDRKPAVFPDYFRRITPMSM